ncbi:MAG: hypothetical protein DDT23_00378 [candidate division WS2 bacterium]|nr:hypothetical protein [Candidatus Lithacetigena glycinireducens]
MITRLQRMIEYGERVVGKKIFLHLSSELVVAKGFCRNGTRSDIVISIPRLKDEKEIESIFMEEITHMLLKQKEHDAFFWKKHSELLDAFQKENAREKGIKV